ncbi:flagellar hook protein FlgE [Abyssisolibacter fermentans]|uniref:flagellar hook protein FlgE n=1 Tax=Abyssisolibacter fermentans TaxID=1766203 RepID=UPI00082F5C5F|nr:flagellar hook protein FlgE [Abyssisolibacter fermentans]
MMRSMYSGVSGLSVHQTKMDVIGNNIANVNTVGYKKSVASFQEAFSQVVQGGSAPYAGRGGTNPQQIGLGMKLGSISTVYTKGPTQRTDNPSDLMIDGDGFFMVSTDPKFENKFYTRAGNFTFDLEGNMCTPDGQRLLGKFIGGDNYAKALGIQKDRDFDGVKLSKSIVAPATSSVKVEVVGNLDSRTPIIDDGNTPDIHENQYKTDAIVKDSLGNSYKMEVTIQKTASNKWKVSKLTVKNIANDKLVYDQAPNKELEFNQSGELITVDPSTGNPIDPVITLLNGDFITTEMGGGFFGTVSGTNELKLDLSRIKQYANDSDAKGHDAMVNGQIGRSAGSYNGYTVDPSGKVIVSFTNGMEQAIWQIKLAKFDNPMGLVKVGNNYYKSSPNSGEANIGIPGASGLGAINGGCLEMSNVDLSMEFTEMITTQRGFQANSRIITTSDEMLQELTNLKR